MVHVYVRLAYFNYHRYFKFYHERMQSNIDENNTHLQTVCTCQRLKLEFRVNESLRVPFVQLTQSCTRPIEGLNLYLISICP